MSSHGYVPYTPSFMQPSPDYGSFATWGTGMGTSQPAGEMNLSNMGLILGKDQLATNASLRAASDRSNQPLTGFAKGAQTFGSIAQGLSGLGSMYLGYQNMKQQKKEFNFNKGVINTNMNNSIMDYNRRLGETLANRALNNGQGAGWVSGELSKFSAKRSQ